MCGKQHEASHRGTSRSCLPVKYQQAFAVKVSNFVLEAGVFR
jgi:hypothetical protein